MKINDLINKVKTSVDSKLSKEKKQEITYYFRMGFRLLIIAALTASLMAFVYSITKDRIAENELAVMEDALEKIFDGCDELKSVKGDYEEPVSAVYEVYKGGQRKGYAIQVAPVGSSNPDHPSIFPEQHLSRSKNVSRFLRLSTA